MARYLADHGRSTHPRIPEPLALHGVAADGDAAYQGASPHIAATLRRRPRRLSRNQEAVNRNLALGEHAVATLKTGGLSPMCGRSRHIPVASAIYLGPHGYIQTP